MPKLVDLTGRRFGELTVLHRVKYTKRTTWHCRCDCGNEADVLADSITTCCKACRYRRAGEKRKGKHPPSFRDLTGQRFGHLVAVLYDSRRRKWVCQCDCGGTITLASTYLTNGSQTDCGCHAATAAGLRIKAGQAGHVGGTNVNTIQHIMDGKLRTTNTSGATGISVRQLARGGEVYRARITVRGKEIPLGTYATMEEAAAARKEAEQKYFAPLTAKSEGNDRERKNY